MNSLQGKWNYQSFTSLGAQFNREEGKPPEVKVPTQLSAAWTPPAIMDFSTDDSGKVIGTANLDGIQFKIVGASNPPDNSLPEGIQLLVTVDAAFASAVTGIAADSVYKLQGSFLKDSDHIVGTVVCVSNDLGFQPDGTSGAFVLYPVVE